MLKIDELKVSYGGIEAVKGITFEVPDGKIVTLIGANGAGKSTTLRSIAGLVKPAHGRIHLQGEDITALSPDRIVSKGITLVPEGRHVFPDLTVLENLKIGAYLRKDSLEDDLNWVYELFPRLKERSWQAAGTLSGGEQQMLAVGRALMSRPKIIMMDEPSLGLAPIVVTSSGRSTSRGSPSCSSSRTPTWPCASPTWAMCWRPGASPSPVPAGSCSPTDRYYGEERTGRAYETVYGCGQPPPPPAENHRSGTGHRPDGGRGRAL